MKTNFLLPSLLLAVGMTSSSVWAEDIVRPTPVPVIAADADRNSVDEPAVIDHVVYLAKLPTPDELVRGADLKGTPIMRMDQTTDRIVVVYQYAGGRTVTFAYSLLSTAGSSRAAGAPQRSTADYSVVQPPPPPPVTTVIYADSPRVYYEPRVRYYDPAWDFWTPLAVGIGLGWGFGGHGHGYGYGGGWHGHGGWRH